MDSSEEWRKLRDLYARMNEGELEVVANEAYDLTDVAKPLLRDEIARRGLKIPLVMERARRRVPPPSADPSKLDLAFGTCWTIEDARSIKEFLDASAIPAFWGPDSVDSPEGLDFGSGVNVGVSEADFPALSRILSRLDENQPEAEPIDYGCPKCKSPDIVFHEVDEQTEKFRWTCDACGHEWNDDGVEQERLS